MRGFLDLRCWIQMMTWILMFSSGVLENPIQLDWGWLGRWWHLQPSSPVTQSQSVTESEQLSQRWISRVSSPQVSYLGTLGGEKGMRETTWGWSGQNLLDFWLHIFSRVIFDLHTSWHPPLIPYPLLRNWGLQSPTYNVTVWVVEISWDHEHVFILVGLDMFLLEDISILDMIDIMK
jgi:hypothetical protein